MTMLAFSLVIPVAQAWWTANAQVRLTRTQIRSTVTNRHSRPIYCKGYVYGRTRSGQVFQNSSNGIVYPNSYGYIYVRTSYYNPFVHGWAQVKCKFN